MADEHLSDAFVKSLHACVVQMEQDMAHNAEATARNTSSIETIRQNTHDIVNTFQALAGGVKVLQGLGRVAAAGVHRRVGDGNHHSLFGMARDQMIAEGLRRK
ncbi:hypothetical protein [Achromobacter ruhlandii]|uniref:hypothetical protein n=1 Tax=Achromobacter ruhlandii TaxID=72557 RepID=UPI0028A9A0BB|nr:hypothetical protein [Achromobacter ruhlandii]